MRSTLALMLLLLLSIWIRDASAIRLGKASVPSDRTHTVHQEEGGLSGLRRSNGEEEEEEEVTVCRSKKCSTGRIRKLSMIHISSTTMNSKNGEMKMEGDPLRVGKVSANSSPEAEPYPDTIDVAGMDYSLQARRRPPIHN